MHKIKNRLKKKGAMLGVEAVMCVLVFLMMFAALLDVINISMRNTILSDTAKELARTLSVQGGSLPTAPDGYEPRTYYNSDQLSALVAANMKRAGFKDGEWNVKINYSRTYDPETNTTIEENTSQNWMGFNGDNHFESSPTKRIDYLSNFTVDITGKYNWIFLAPVIGKRTTILRSSLPGVSEWRYQYDYWGSEPGNLNDEEGTDEEGTDEE